MKRLLIIFFMCFASCSYITQAQDLGNIFDKLNDVLDEQYDPYLSSEERLLESLGKVLDLVEDEFDESEGLQFSSYSKCYYVMIKYAIEYKKHEDRINNSVNCQEKYDLYGVLLMYLASSTTISYCPESFLELFQEPNFDEMMKFYEELTLMREMASYYIMVESIDGVNRINSNNLINKLHLDMIMTIAMV